MVLIPTKWSPAQPGTITSDNLGIKRLQQNGVIRLQQDGTPRLLEDTVVTSRPVTAWSAG